MIEWSTHHKDDPPLPEDDENRDKRSDDIDPWDQEFLKVDQGTLFELILVSVCWDVYMEGGHSERYPLPLPSWLKLYIAFCILCIHEALQ